MQFKPLLMELLQATGFCTILTFLFTIAFLERNDDMIGFTLVALVLGGIPTMLAKRFILSLIKEVKAAS
ncbi:hypothetical protein [Shewanella sp. SM95]|uniref:hypothetical protein n=1 Tax=Shewanella sp. SM95 TaxID=2912812 RepID=UPI0021DB68E8|nr:hypothetical protein [Shewanella sp. SM95]MCU8000783.1 hypothetical protein [Shewanella sp. SM95]